MAEWRGGLEHPWGISGGSESKWLSHCNHWRPCSRPMPATIPKPLWHQPSLAPHAVQWVLLVCHGEDGCDVWALDAVWKKQAWPEIFGFRKGRLDFAGEQVSDRLLPYSSCSPLQPHSHGHHLLCTLRKKKMCPFGKRWHPAPTLGSEANGMLGEEG